MGLYEGEGLLSGGGAYNRNEIFVGRYMGLYPGELIHGGGGLLVYWANLTP